MKISKRVREEAARLCSILACNAAARTRETWCWSTVNAREATGVSRRVASVAHYAWAEAVLTAWPAADAFVRYAEAEALLRTGWTP